MANPLAKNLHLSPGTKVYQRCVAEKSCPFFEGDKGNASHSDVHLSLVEIASDGGGEVKLDGHGVIYDVSPLKDSVFSVGRAGSRRTTTYDEAGQKLSPREAAFWRKGKLETTVIRSNVGVLRVMKSEA